MTDTFNATEFTATQIAYVGGTYGPYLDKGEYWRLLTASYIHLNLPHIAFNMLALLVWGRKVSQRLGFIRFIVFYTICGILGSLVSVTYQPEVVAAGASGAISGVLAELFVLRFAGDPTIEAQGLVGVFIYNAVYSVAMPNIDWRAHAGGFVAGLIVGYALLLTVPENERRSSQPQLRKLHLPEARSVMRLPRFRVGELSAWDLGTTCGRRPKSTGGHPGPSGSAEPGPVTLTHTPPILASKSGWLDWL